MTNRGDAKLAGLRLNESGKQETRNGDRGQNGRNLRNPRSVFLSSCFPKDRKSTRLNSSHSQISYAVFCLKKKLTHSRACYPKPQVPKLPMLHAMLDAAASLAASMCPITVAVSKPPPEQ